MKSKLSLVSVHALLNIQNRLINLVFSNTKCLCFVYNLSFHYRVNKKRQPLNILKYPLCFQAQVKVIYRERG